MRIVLISANTEPFPDAVFPLGAVLVGNALRTAGAEVRILDMRRHSPLSLKDELAAFSPDRIGISLRNADNAAYPATRSYLSAYTALVRSLREFTGVPVVLGGSAFSLFPEEMLHRLGADSGVRGEGECALSAFLGPSRERIVTGGFPDIDDIAFPPGIDTMFPGFRAYRTIGIQTARGCPNRCIYCTYPVLEGRKRRHRRPEAVAAEIDLLYRRFGIRDFFIVDSLFNADEEHMIAVAERIASLDIRIRFSCYLKPRVSDPSIFRLLKRSGCAAVDFGTDSGSPALLASLGKPFSRDDILRASRACTEAGIDFCHSLLFGGPGETPETISETAELMDEAGPKAVIAMTGVRIYPGTEIARIAADEGIVAEGDSLLAPRFYFPPMGPYSLLRYVHERAQGRRNWFFPGKRDWGSAIGFKVLRFLYRKGPLWRILRR